MYEVFADLHVHIGRSENGKPIKITAARSLNFANIAKECAERKGINIVGIIDCASPYVIEDIENFLKTGDAYELKDGGIIYKDKVCILLGSEVETSEKGRNGKCGAAHNVCFFPHLKDIKGFSNEMSHHIKNITLSTQRSNVSGYELIDIVEKYNGILIPAHIFTPFKSYYGNCTDRLENIFKEKYDKIFAVELGLSSDTFLADEISELENKTFVTNSDAHSLPKIAREYNKMQVEDISFKEVVKALKNEDGRKIIANYGLDPKLGKYHRTYCDNCNQTIETKEPVEVCPYCGSNKVTFGVFDRIELIKDKIGGRKMEIITTVDGVRKQVKEWRKEGLSVGLVPTMGYLHEGHKSLIDKAVAENDRVVVSVFVNPIQFGPTEDLASYPRDLDRDAELCEKAGANVIFHPEDSEMYFDDFCTYVDMDDLTKGLCGKTRPTHFRGVCTVVSKLFHIVAPDRAYFGQKDAQQLAVIRRMVRDLNFDIEIVGCPIVREADGLAKSSRNTYLSAEERTAATVLHKGLTAGEELLRSGEKNAAKVVAEIRKVIENEPLAKIDYVELVDWNTLKPVETVSGQVLCAVAVYIGKTRLIDNFIR